MALGSAHELFACGVLRCLRTQCVAIGVCRAFFGLFMVFLVIVAIRCLSVLMNV